MPKHIAKESDYFHTAGQGGRPTRAASKPDGDHFREVQTTLRSGHAAPATDTVARRQVVEPESKPVTKKVVKKKATPKKRGK